MLDEQFVILPQYPNYSISNYGRIVNNTTKRDLTPYPDKRTGHLRVNLYVNGVRHYAQVNRLVAECFFLNYRDDVEVGHKNHDKSDNGVLNLTIAANYRKSRRGTK